MSGYVTAEVRDAVIEECMLNPQNRLCFDCRSKDPKWASPYLGIFICYECTARHRSYGTHISFVRSIDLDNWNKKQIKSIELSGNQYTLERFTQLGIPQSGLIFDYTSELVIKFRADLANKVNMILSSSTSTQDKLQPKPKRENKPIVEEPIKEEKPKEIYKEPTKFEIKEESQITTVKSQGKAGKKNQIKKAEFDFDFDAFDDIDFNQFNKAEATPDPEPKKKEKDEDLEEKENQKENTSSSFKAYDIKLSEEEVKKKFANKKAISSDDYAALEDNGNESKYYNNKIKQMGNCSSISSSDVYGIKEEPTSSLGSKLKETALYYTLAAAEKAKAIKNQTTSYFNKVQNKFGGNN